MPLACHQLVLKTCRTRDHNQEEQRQLLTSLLKRKLLELLICSEGTGEKSTTDQGQRFHHTCGTCSRRGGTGPSCSTQDYPQSCQMP